MKLPLAKVPASLSRLSEPTAVKRILHPMCMELDRHSKRCRSDFATSLPWEGSDHVALSYHIQLSRALFMPKTLLPNGFSWKKADRGLIEVEAKKILPPWERGRPLDEPKAIDEYVDYIYSHLNRIAEAATPRRRRGKVGYTPWWTPVVGAADRATQTARRSYQTTPSPLTQQRLRDSIRYKNKVIQVAQTRSWRKAMAEASAVNEKIWRLERWARLKSFLPPSDSSLPPLHRGEWEQLQNAHEAKAEILAEKFFPRPEADLSDLTPEAQLLAERDALVPLQSSVDEADIADILGKTAPWKAPGEDGIPTGFLKMCGEPLRVALAALAQASFEEAYWPQRFRSANVVVIPKADKTPEQKHLPNAWRPIALLNSMGKVVEKLLSKRIANAAEAHDLLPQGQMGNRRNRSTELAIRTTTEAIYTAWGHGAIASLYQLDISGAFDHTVWQRLVDILHKMGFPLWLIRWTRSYLSNRTATLLFDGAASTPRPLYAGVPQGSPLSPIFFLLYSASLYKAAEGPGVIVVAFADDTNLITVGRDLTENCGRLSSAFDRCTAWGATHGMTFGAAKSVLVHFTRAQAAPTQPVRLSDGTVTRPSESTRFLGVFLDRKLRWNRHLKELRAKLEKQRFALTSLAASTWGCSSARAKEIYTKVVRSAIAYGASAWHTYSREAKAKGLASRLLAEQSRCLRVVAGAYKATPIPLLEVETGCPPLDVYLDERLAAFEQRLRSSPAAAYLITIKATLRATILRRRGRGRLRRVEPKSFPYEEGADKAAWSQEWARSKTPLLDEWERRLRVWRESRPRCARLPAELGITFSTDLPLRYLGIKKHESLMLLQMRTEAIGLRSFLFRRNVPGVPTPRCSCGGARETAYHVVLECPRFATQRTELRGALAPRALLTRRDYDEALRQPGVAAVLAKWMLRLGLLRMYRLARAFNAASELRWHEAPEAGKKRKGREKKGAEVRVLDD